MKKAANLLESFLRLAIIGLLSAMTLIVVLGIFARYVFLISIPWTEEISRYLMIWTAFLAFGVAFRRRELISVRLLIDRLSAAMMRRMLLFSDLLCCIFLIVAVVFGTKLCIINNVQVSPAARIPMSIIYSAIPLGCLIYLMFVVESLVAYFKADNLVQ